MNKNDLQIVNQLRLNARMSLTAMSRKTGIPISTLFDKIKSRISNLVIKYTSLLDFYRLGYGARAMILIKVNKEDKEQLKEYLSKATSVNSVMKISNGYDFILEGVFKEMKDMDSFVENMEAKFNIVETRTFFVIDDVKREGFVAG